jgi:hypothetical protein
MGPVPRFVVMLVASVALAILPAGPARAAGSVAYCFHQWTDTATPGVGTTPSKSHFTSNGEKWALICQGSVRGQRVTGPGTFGEEGTIEGTCSSGSGLVNFSFTIPTAAGAQQFRLTFGFLYGPGGGTARTQDFPGVFLFYPTKGDCMSAPVTELNIVRNAVLFS